MSAARRRYVPALGLGFLTRLYDPVAALTTRERVFKRRLLEGARLAPGQRILDLGCGTGTLMLLAKRMQPRVELSGIDADPVMLARARAKAQRARVSLRLDQGLAWELPYPDRTFDRVLSSLVFHHLLPPDKERTLLAVRRVLRPGGELHVADWGRPSRPLMRWLFYAIQLFDGFENTRPHVEGRLPDLLEAAGLERVERTDCLDTMFGTLELYRAQRPLAPGDG